MASSDRVGGAAKRAKASARPPLALAGDASCGAAVHEPAAAAASIDLDHLSAQTMGDAALKADILRMFLNQLDVLGNRLARASREERREIAHTTFGTAANVGAFPLAEAAFALERQETGSEKDAFLREADRTAAFIRRLLA